MKRLLTISLLAGVLSLSAQDDCLREVLEYEKNTAPISDSATADKNVYFSYTVKATDWENESTISNVKIYKRGGEMHFFSEQVNMYSDEKETIVEMPGQKIIMWNETHPSGKRNSIDLSAQWRKEFLDSCRVVSCKSSGKNTRLLILKANPAYMEAGIRIAEMHFEYDTEKKKVLSVKTTYYSDYKLKNLLVIYREYTPESSYAFTPFRSRFIDRKGRLTEKYRSYELVDNRDKKTETSSSR
jgi:hypothetical protein